MMKQNNEYHSCMSETSHPMMSSSKSSRKKQRAFGYSQWVCLILIASMLFNSTGCSRNFWRSQADFDAYNLLQQKQFDPHWVIPRTSLEADARSRFYDPYDKDRPPLPPDDPAASRYMEWVNGWRGYKSWHKFGQMMSVENPQWLAAFGLAPDSFHDSYLLSDGITDGTDISKLPGGVKDRVVPTIENLTLAQTIELASIHSRDYQTQLEALFSSAMQLSLDQFQFQVRYLVGRAPTAPTTALPGTAVPTGVLNNSTVPGVVNSLGLTTAGGVSQILPTGGQWIVGLANNTMWLFQSGGQQTTSQSLLSYSLVQPFLAGAGRKLFLENLTFSERNVLYNVRTLSRFRRIFFADAVVNTQGGGGSSATAISAGTGASVVNPTVISTNASAQIGAGQTVGSTAAQAGGIAGYYGLLFFLQRLLNQHENVEQFRSQAERLKELVSQRPFRRLEVGALPDGIQFPAPLSEKIEYTPENHRLRWKDDGIMTDTERDELLALSNDPAYQAAVREIFIQLRVGVTTLDYLQVATQLTGSEIQERNFKQAYDDEVDQFKFFLGLPTDMQVTVDRSLLKQFEITDPLLYTIEKRLIRFVSVLFSIDDANPSAEDLNFALEQFARLAAVVGQTMESVTTDVDRVRAIMPKRLERLLWDESREIVERRFERDQLIFENVRATYYETMRSVEEWSRLIDGPELPLAERQRILARLKDAREDILQVVQNVRVLQTGLRAETIELIDFPMTLEEAVETALENRVDLMNQKARVMDVRRNMEVAANRLEAILNLVAQGNLSTPATGNHPLDFRGAASNFQVGLQMAAPLDQVQVRNSYRQSIIAFQQARRAYMLLEDQVKYDIRTSWRQLKVNAQIFEATRKQLRQSALQLDINTALSLNPNELAVGQAGTTRLGNTGLNLITAVNALLSAQNNLIQFWVFYERNRINIYRDMDIMEVDERGVWVDPFYQNLADPHSQSLPNESANDIPPEPAAHGIINNDDDSASFKKRSTSRVITASANSRTGAAEGEMEEYGDRGRRTRAGGRRLASDEIRLVSDFDSLDEDDGSDRGAGDGDGQEGIVPDHSHRKGNSRQHAKRRPLE